MVIVELPIFTRRIKAIMNDDEYRFIQQLLVDQPTAGPVIQQSGGLWKLRWGLQNKGKSGGLRLIYYYDAETYKIYMVFIYAKNAQTDLTPQQIRQLRELMQGDI